MRDEIEGNYMTLLILVLGDQIFESGFGQPNKKVKKLCEVLCIYIFNVVDGRITLICPSK